MTKPFKYYSSLLVTVVLLWFCIWWIYQPGILGPLLMDDWSSLSVLQNSPVNDFQSLLLFVFGNSAGPGGRPVAMMSFLLDGQSWPMDVSRLKQSNIVIHLLCGMGVWIFSAKLFQCMGLRRRQALNLALLAAAMWMLHPLNVSTVLYVVQRMAQLAALFVLLSCILFLYGRTAIIEKPARGLALLILSLFPFGLLAVFSKENAVLLPVCFLLMEFTLFAKSESNEVYKRWLQLGVLLPSLIILVYLAITFGGTIEGYEYRHFGLGERLLTQARVLTSYQLNLFVPLITKFSIYHDDIVVSTGLFQPVTTFFSILWLGSLTILALKFRKTSPVFSFSVLWFFLWHILESSYIPLELYFEHRNYLPMLGPIIGVCYYLLRAMESVKTVFLYRFLASLGVSMVLVLALLSWQLTNLWGNAGAMTTYWALQHPESKRAQAELAILLFTVGLHEDGLAVLNKVKTNYPRDVGLDIHIWNYACALDLQSNTTIKGIAENAELESFHDDVNIHLATMIENLKLGACVYPSQLEMLSLMDKISSLSVSARHKASFNVLYSELLVHYELFDQALAKLDLAFENQPSVDIALRQGSLAGAVGQFDLALELLNKAYAADDKRGFPLPSRREDIEDLRLRLEADMLIPSDNI